jgi:hypothetical protein
MIICNAKKNGDTFFISGETTLRIANAHIHDCRIANSAGRDFRLCKPVQSGSFAFRYDAGWSLRRAGCQATFM